MARSVLITQCIQRDFVDPVRAFDPLPNRLHVGHAEAERLLGLDPSAGPLMQLMRWARLQAPEDLSIVHIRDWHDPADPRQQAHLRRFGPHCLRGTRGAAFAFDAEDAASRAPNEHIVNAMAEAAVNIEMISTSEIRISVVCRDTELDIAVRAVHEAFELGTGEPEAVVYGGSGR